MKRMLICLIGWLTVACLLLCGVAVFVGGRIPTSIFVYTPFNKLHLLDARLLVSAKISDEVVVSLPVWSKNGRQFAFAGVHGQIFIWDWDGGKTRLFVPVQDGERPFAWSRDGTELFVAGWGDDRDVLLRYPLDGAKNPLRQQFVENAEVYISAETHNGQYFIFQVSALRNTQIYRSALDGTQPEPLTQGSEHLLPVLSPDGTQIAYLGDVEGSHELFVMDVDGRHQRQLTHDGHGQKWPPVWSPDGQEILMQTYFNYQRPMVLDVVRADGSGQRRIAEDQEIYAPSWSPDGSSILYIVYRKENGQLSTTLLYLVDADGQNRRLVMPLLNPNILLAWQPKISD